MKKAASLLLMLGATALTSASPLPAPAELMAGAARVKITPSPAELVDPFKTIADDIHVRAVVIDSGGKRAVVIVADVPTISAKVSADIVGRISAQAHVPAANIVLGTSHTHNAMRVATEPGILIPASPKFVERVTAATLEAVRQAEARLQPARAGVGRGKAYLIANRNQWSPAHGRYITGVDRTGNEPIDHSLGVMKFETLDGKPIAFLLNYAIEPVVAMAIPSEISGDVPGAVSRMIEDRAGGDAVALFTIGAAGAPLYESEHSPIERRRAHTLSLIDGYATILAEEGLAVARDLATSPDAVTIGGESRQLVCPGKITTPLNLPNRCAYTPGSKLPVCEFSDKDTDPVTLNHGVVRIGDVAIVQTDANVTPALGAKLQRATPIANTWIVALTYGPMKYVMDDAAYPLNTYEATASIARRGCAEKGYLTGTSKMMSRLW
ncbi:neutral/alkaline non-lysosomal ceramidase N-terminal domain-containing protein [Sphingomonas sp. G-3-2-10]|uniref:neutral/alkaline non-lysosomal ceramidase N-terminal domain-containing protein n=1 Tax=Sphingomonas sp. G-3-2-10 TaxID=2728838 RepID=UPI00146B9C2C|nr:neutral/alkaline non-lysosomal ceramidase N-terminal domain-containing protein [Sphingomonas sp. G-3-2-10]NML08282.1 hypothetical protein [Sphingomonas sp. G-3-2-10]